MLKVIPPEKAKFAWNLALSQVNQVFVLAVAMIAVGFAFVLWGITLSMGQPKLTPTSAVAAAAGIITQFIGATVMVIYRSTMAQANEFMGILERINTVGMAIQVLESIPEGPESLKNETRANIIGLLLSSSGRTAKKNDHQEVNRLSEENWLAGIRGRSKRVLCATVTSGGDPLFIGARPIRGIDSAIKRTINPCEANCFCVFSQCSSRSLSRLSPKLTQPDLQPSCVRIMAPRSPETRSPETSCLQFQSVRWSLITPRVVTYAKSGFPGWPREEGHPGVKSTKAVDDFLLKLLPLSMRGKELRKMQGQQGLASVLWTEYENVTISEVSQGQGRTGVTVIFTNEKC
jgi:hypothetical protein